MMKKGLKAFGILIIIVLIIVIGLIVYAKPNEELTLQYTPIQLNEKINKMVASFKTELVLTESDIDAWIKQNMDMQLNDYAEITGARFYLENNSLQANVIMKVRDAIKLQLHAEYDVSWEEPNLIITPRSLSLKDIPLPVSLLEPIITSLYNPSSTIVKITDIEPRGQELVVKWKLELFDW